MVGLNVFKVSVAGAAVRSVASVDSEVAAFDFALDLSFADGLLGYEYLVVIRVYVEY